MAKKVLLNLVRCKVGGRFFTHKNDISFLQHPLKCLVGTINHVVEEILVWFCPPTGKPTLCDLDVPYGCLHAMRSWVPSKNVDLPANLGE